MAVCAQKSDCEVASSVVYVAVEGETFDDHAVSDVDQDSSVPVLAGDSFHPTTTVAPVVFGTILRIAHLSSAAVTAGVSSFVTLTGTE